MAELAKSSRPAAASKLRKSDLNEPVGQSKSREPKHNLSPTWQRLALRPIGNGEKLNVSQPGDPYEQEADQVADRVMRTPVAAANGDMFIQRKCDECEDEEKIQRKEANARSDSVDAVPPIVQETLSSSGQPLDPETRSFMEPRFGYDFGDVRTHTDGDAGAATRAVQARAFTVGPDIVFGINEYHPGTSEGRSLLAHELAHVVQQSNQNQGHAHLARKPDAPQAGGSAEVKKAAPPLTWLQILPRVHMADETKRKQRDKGLTSVEHEHEKAPVLKYVDENKMSITPGAPEGQEREIITIDDPEQLSELKQRTETEEYVITGEALAVEFEGESLLEKTLNNIKAVRASIPMRQIERSPFNPKKLVGNFYDPKRAADKGDKQAAEYNQWIATATPTTNFDPTNDDDLKKWQIFLGTKELEGRVGTVTTSDKTLTIGAGFSSAGTQAEQVIRKLFAALPELKDLAFSAGLMVDKSNNLVVVDTEKGWILEGLAAADFVQTNPSLLSLFINASQGVQGYTPGGTTTDVERDKQRQAMLNAQWQTFLAHALKGIPSSILGWPIESVVLAVHSRHATQKTFPWSFWELHRDTNLKEMVRAIYRELKATNQLFFFKPICGGIYEKHAKVIQAEEEAAARGRRPGRH